MKIMTDENRREERLERYGKNYVLYYNIYTNKLKFRWQRASTLDLLDRVDPTLQQ